ncbi:Aflatoxin B1 aldehyde reductase member 2 [Fusarium albosuccineum]|uniref:Aflatoxin B1 aldehyde reductase member 2 n=1 Tax=Fusarium albosuccineum TaxID=1237068 RepID=A0A8H4P9Q2_9HYPO|nr:Aflatoxin B1 aldehyde reductase member 2 [Fusarium albosuccineum]
MGPTRKSPLTLVLGAGNVGDTSSDPIARYSTPDKVNAFFNAFAKRGYNQIDTARGYSLHAPGTSEPRIGAICPGDRFIIDSKADPTAGYTKESVLRDIDASLDALKVDQINIYYLHAPDRKNPPEPAIQALNQACKEGKIKAWGISNYRADEVQNTLDFCEDRGFVKPSIYQGHYNPVVRGGEKELFPLLRKNNIAFSAYSPAGAGFFAGSSKTAKPKSRPTIEAAVNKALEVASKHGIGGHAAALRWTAYHSILNRAHGDALVVGASSPEQLETNIDHIEEGPLPDDVAAAFEAVGQEAGDEIKYHF